ncbi:MAG: DUF2325 domain-containing protein [Pseudomonadota bacterium]
MCDSHANRFAKLALPLLPTADHASPQPSSPVRDRRRLKIWEMRDHLGCSVIGTCLAESDLNKILRKLKVQVPPNMPSHDLHSQFVEAVEKDCPLARAVQKLLDRRHETIIRLVGRTTCEQDLNDIWDRAYQSGRIPGAYWAFQTHAHISDALFRRIFGEVHMLSHVLGRTTHATAQKASELEARIADLEGTLARRSRMQRESLAERDSRIARLERALADLRGSMAVQTPTTNAAPAGKVTIQHNKQARVLIAARERARRAEAQVGELQADVHRLKCQQRALTTKIAVHDDIVDCPGANACQLNVPSGETLRVLYLGGRTGAVENLRMIAERASAEFQHHDGGKQEAVGRIPDLIKGCHVVFCPVNCISHRACLLAKEHCRKLDKGFVPLRSAGSTSFERALKELRVTG